MARSSPLPTHSVDVPALDAAAARSVEDDRARARMRLVFLAAFVFAALAWIGTFFVAVHSSETNGIRASWVAIFPTCFGGAGLVALNVGRGPLASVGVALLAGCAGSVLLFLFFLVVWEAL